ncbi:MAG: hypothetical protein U9R39_02185 [Campylobacterota bacterium]|nr:hypothetical protein [Campylobacterota bacterium]
MSGLAFSISLLVILVVLLLRFKIVNFINKNFDVDFQSEWIVYFLTIIFIMVIAMGMLLDDTKNKYGQVSEGFKNLKPKQEDRPNPMFDINTYW